MNRLLKFLVCGQKIRSLGRQTGASACFAAPLALHHAVAQAPLQAVDHVPGLGVGHAGTGAGDAHIIRIINKIQQQLQQGGEEGLLLLQFHVQGRMHDGEIVGRQLTVQLLFIVGIGQDALVVHIHPGSGQGLQGAPEAVLAGIGQDLGDHLIGKHDGMASPALPGWDHDLPRRAQQGLKGIGGKHGYIDRCENHTAAFALQVTQSRPDRIHQFRCTFLFMFQKNHAKCGQFPLQFLVITAHHNNDGKYAYLLVGNDDAADDGNGSHLKHWLGHLVIGDGNDAANFAKIHNVPPTVIPKRR